MPQNGFQAIKKPVGENSDRASSCTYIAVLPGRFQQQGTEYQVNDTPQNHGQRSGLAANGIRGSPHQRRNHGAAENSGNHQTRNFIRLVGTSTQSNRIDNRENA